MAKEYDWIVLGGGSAGYAGARTAVAAGLKVAVVDAAPELGGLCILKGCMPSKTLIYSAEVLHQARRGERFGLTIPEATVDMPALKRRKDHWVSDFASYRVQQLTDGRFDLFRQSGRLTAPHEVTLVDGQVLKGARILLATGSAVQFPSIPHLSGPRTVTSDDVLDWDQLPTSVIVLGGGIVACELSQYLLRLGVKVTLIQRSSQILRAFSPDISEAISQALREEGMTLFTGTRIHSIEHRDASVCVEFSEEGGTRRVEAEILFNALGRTPRTQNLGLEACGIRLRPNGQIETSPWQETSLPGHYAAGDCTGPHEIVHIAVLQGELSVRHGMKTDCEPINYEDLLSVVFTDPQIGVVGLSEAVCRERGMDYRVATYPFADHGKSLLMEAPEGFVKVIAEAGTLRILGAECIGKDAGELIHSMGVAVSLQATVRDLLKVHWYHPTLSEIWTYPLEELVES